MNTPLTTDSDLRAVRRVQARKEATELLTHYFRTVWERAGLTWTSDNYAEIEALVDALVAAAE